PARRRPPPGGRPPAPLPRPPGGGEGGPGRGSGGAVAGGGAGPPGGAATGGRAAAGRRTGPPGACRGGSPRGTPDRSRGPPTRGMGAGEHVGREHPAQGLRPRRPPAAGAAWRPRPRPDPRGPQRGLHPSHSRTPPATPTQTQPRRPHAPSWPDRRASLTPDIPAGPDTAGAAPDAFSRSSSFPPLLISNWV